MSFIAEYIWIDGVGELRSKGRTVKRGMFDGIPKWNFDGSSCGQAANDDSDIILVPRAVYNDPFRRHPNKLVMCDCYDENEKPISTNKRFQADKIFKQCVNDKPWFGLEQEYVLYDKSSKKPLGWEDGMEKQGKYYCGVGCDRAFGREIVEEHYRLCLEAGLEISGINGEVMPGQWEFQVGPCEGISAADQLWIARYILHRVCEKSGVLVTFHPKPEKGDWNGSGCHTNYSSLKMREEGGIKHIMDAIKKLESKHQEHLDVYGNNEERLIGTHETSSKDKFTYGISDRSASVRIPLFVEKDGCGYFEDRRPASDCDPYLVTSKLAETTLL